MSKKKSMYDRLGYGKFWERYGDSIENTDKLIVMPIFLKASHTHIGTKWRWDSNGYLVKYKNKTFEIVFEFYTVRGPLMIEIRKNTETFDLIGTFSVIMPIKQPKRTSARFAKFIKETIELL